MTKTPLELIINEIIHQPDNNFHPLQLNDRQIDFLAEHWSETQECITNLIVEKEMHCFDFRNIFEDLKKKGIKPAAEYVKENIYESLIAQKRFHDVSRLSKDINMPPSPEQIKNIWRYFFESEWHAYDLESLVSHFGTPELSQEQVNYVGNNWLAEFAGERKREHLETQPKDMRKIINILGKTPQWDKNLANRVYDHWLDFHFHSELFDFLQEFIGARPNEKKVKEYYAKFLSENKNYSHSYVESIYYFFDKAIKSTGILPDEKTVKIFYRDFLDHRNVEWMRKIENLTSIKLSEEDIQNIYKELLNNGRTAEINLLKNATKIKPEFDDATMQSAYKELFKEHKINYAFQVYLLTDIDPEVEPNSVVEACKELIRDSEKPGIKGYLPVEAVRWLVQKFPKETEPAIRDWIHSLISKEEFRYAKELIHDLRLSEDSCPEERFVFACRSANWEYAKGLYEKNKQKIEEKYPKYARVIECVIS